MRAIPTHPAAVLLVVLVACSSDRATGPDPVPFAGRYVLEGAYSPSGGAFLGLPAAAPDTLGRELTLLEGTLEIDQPRLSRGTALGSPSDTGSASFRVRLQMRGGSPPAEFQREASGRYFVFGGPTSVNGGEGWTLIAEPCRARPAPPTCLTAPFTGGGWAAETGLTTGAMVGFRTQQETIDGQRVWQVVVLKWRRQ